MSGYANGKARIKMRMGADPHATLLGSADGGREMLYYRP